MCDDRNRPEFPGRRVWLAMMAVAALSLVDSGSQAADGPPANEKTVRVTIDYGDGVEKSFQALPWKEGQTAFAALEAAAKHPRGIKIKHQGSGATTLVTGIDDRENEGLGRNWLFEVNGKLGEKSSALVELKAGDAVLWRFAKYR